MAFYLECNLRRTLSWPSTVASTVVFDYRKMAIIEFLDYLSALFQDYSKIPKWLLLSKDLTPDFVIKDPKVLSDTYLWNPNFVRHTWHVDQDVACCVKSSHRGCQLGIALENRFLFCFWFTEGGGGMLSAKQPGRCRTHSHLSCSSWFGSNEIFCPRVSHLVAGRGS